MKWEYDSNADLLKITHFNAAYSSCLTDISASINVMEDTIMIQEQEISPSCFLPELYDVEHSIQNIEPGEYIVQIDGSDIEPEDDPILFNIDLERDSLGMYCMDRNHYPWAQSQSSDAAWETLEDMGTDVIDYIGTPLADNDEDCGAVIFGSKPCGGPWSYLVYSALTLDENILKAKTWSHFAYNKVLNQRYGVASDCMFVSPPSFGSVNGICEELE